jgi:mannose-1-phosphate guanylyltransferase
VMGDLDVFSATLRGGMDLAEKNDILVTIGIEPTFPSSGFGYVESGETLSTVENVEFRKAVRFVEKPDEATAAQYLATGKFYWNSGMFIWSVQALEKAFGAHCPAMLELMSTLTDYARDGKIVEGMDATYPDLGKISVDYALMEKAENIVMACGTFSWDDVGSWPALESHFEQDEGGNTKIGQVETLGSDGNIILSKDRLTAVIGVKDLIVVQADGVTLVCPKDRAQDIKQMVVALREKGCYDAVL